MVVRLAILVFLALVSAAQAKPLLVDDAQLATLRANTKVVASLLKRCGRELAEPTHAVAIFAPTPHYTAQGANPDDDQARGLTGDIRRAYRAALCYRLSGSISYAKKAQEIADAWASTMTSVGSAQGRSDINFNVAQLIIAASWVEGANDWSTSPFKSWLAAVIAPLSLSAEPNNRGNWGNLQDVAVAAFIGDKAGLQSAAARWRELLVSQVAEDGTLPLEICRSNSSNHCDGPDKGVNGLAYTHYALLPATLAGALLAENALNDRSLNAYAKAIGKAAAFTRNPEQFPFYASNAGKLNKIDACSYFALAQHLAPDENARAVLSAGKCKSDSWMLQELFGAN